MTINRAVVAVRRGVGSAVILGAAVIGGCSQDDARPLTADAFVSRRVEGRANPQPVDQPGLIIPSGVKPPAYEGTDPPEVTAISPAVREVVRGSAPAANGAKTRPPGTPEAGAGEGTGPAVRPDGEGPVDPVPSDTVTPRESDPATGTPPNDPSGQYVVVGTVLSKVNNQPIYAHKVLASIDSALRAEAKQHDPQTFRQVAVKLIADEIQYQERNEVVFAAAQKVLAERERMLADVLAARWRNEQITMAGGSLELAKRRWADEGWDFDERVAYEYRDAMRRIYVEKRVMPLVQVTASDVRRYYDANRGKDFTKPARIKFRVIKIDPRRNTSLGLAGPAEAERLAQTIREDAVSGPGKDDFEALARQVNDPVLKESGGRVGDDEGWLSKGSYAAEKVEQAAWLLEPGQVSEVIEEDGAFYVAKLEERQDATEAAFEDLAVQEWIRNQLRAQQLRELTDREERRLRADAVVQRQPNMLRTALDMAMQRYPAWAAAK